MDAALHQVAVGTRGTAPSLAGGTAGTSDGGVSFGGAELVHRGATDSGVRVLAWAAKTADAAFGQRMRREFLADAGLVLAGTVLAGM